LLVPGCYLDLVRLHTVTVHMKEQLAKQLVCFVHLIPSLKLYLQEIVRNFEIICIDGKKCTLCFKKGTLEPDRHFTYTLC
jgi:hypothetical protein